MLASVFIIVISSALFVYWFRYTCILILQQRSIADSAILASVIRLNFPQIHHVLQAESQEPFGGLHQALQEDYRLLTDLLHDATGSRSVEHRLLALDYHVMRGWYAVTKERNRGHARKALAEMSAILMCLAADIQSAPA